MALHPCPVVLVHEQTDRPGASWRHCMLPALSAGCFFHLVALCCPASGVLHSMLAWSGYWQPRCYYRSPISCWPVCRVGQVGLPCGGSHGAEALSHVVGLCKESTGHKSHLDKCADVDWRHAGRVPCQLGCERDTLIQETHSFRARQRRAR